MRKSILFMMLSFMVVCIGCDKQPVTSDKAASNQTPNIIEITVPESYNYEEGNLTIDMELQIPKELQLKKSTAKIVKFGEMKEQIKDAILPGDDWYVDTSDTCLDYDGNTCTDYAWYASEEFAAPYLDVSNRGVDGVLTENGYDSIPSKVDHSFRGNELVDIYETEDLYNANLYSTEENLSFASAEDALEMCMNEMDKAGIELGDLECECFSLTSKVMEQEYKLDEMEEVIPNSFCEDDNAYNIYARQKWQELPVFFYNSWFSGLPDNSIGRESFPIHFLYSKQGIESFSIQRLFRFEESDECYDALKPFDEIMDSLKKRYTNLISDSQFTINKGNLFYYAKKTTEDEYDMIPVWVFQEIESSTVDGPYSEQKLVIIDAVTGLEMEYE